MADSPTVTFELRVPDEGDFEAFMLPVWRGFGYPAPEPEAMADERSVWERERSIGAVDGEEWVGGAGAYSLRLTVPGGAQTPVAGVTMVGVATTHRRQGILTALMRRQLDDVAERGELIAALTASETSIYGRYGYGWATATTEVELERDRSAFRVEPQAPGRLRVLPTADALEPVRAAYDRCITRRAGTMSRDEGYWKIQLGDAPRRRDGNSAMYVVVHEDAEGRPDGFVTYRIAFRWHESLPDNTVVVLDLVGADPEVEAVLWGYLLSIDLASRIRFANRPVDDPIRWRLVEPRRLRTRELVDYLWLRILDVPGALALRTYGATDALVLDVVEGFRPASGGRFRLDGSPAGAECAATTAPPDLVLGPEELGSIYLGGIAPSALAAAGRIQEATPGAVARADAMFLTATAPFNGTMF